MSRQVRHTHRQYAHLDTQPSLAVTHIHLQRWIILISHQFGSFKCCECWATLKHFFCDVLACPSFLLLYPPQSYFSQLLCTAIIFCNCPKICSFEASTSVNVVLLDRIWHLTVWYVYVPSFCVGVLENWCLYSRWCPYCDGLRVADVVGSWWLHGDVCTWCPHLGLHRESFLSVL